jgi:hypothetical protein
MNARARKGRDRLERIAALLLSLAGLAERAATRSAPVRFIVLWLLRQAEGVAADFVADTTPQIPIWDGQPAPDHSGHTPADALALALSLRLLALAVQAMATDATRLPDEASISACLERFARIILALKRAAPTAAELRDTS